MRWLPGHGVTVSYKRELGEITPKVLTETLRQLEYDAWFSERSILLCLPKLNIH